MSAETLAFLVCVIAAVFVLPVSALCVIVGEYLWRGGE